MLYRTDTLLNILNQNIAEMHVAEKNLITIVFHVKTEFIQHRYIATIFK